MTLVELKVLPHKLMAGAIRVGDFALESIVKNDTSRPVKATLT